MLVLRGLNCPPASPWMTLTSNKTKAISRISCSCWLTYRCLLQRLSQFRGLVAASGYAVGDRHISDGYRRILDERQHRYQQILDRLKSLKSKCDRRLTCIAALPMIHRVIPVEPAFPIASTSFTPVTVNDRHIATTLYPEPLERPIARLSGSIG